MAKRRQGHKASKYDQPLFPELEEEIKDYEETLAAVKSRELQIRTSVNILSDFQTPPNFPPIILPNRWEALQAEASKRKVPLKPLITPVRDAIMGLKREIRRVQETGTGKLFIISGVTGSGKTTFLNSLQLFIDGIGVHNIKLMTIDRRETVENALATLRREQDKISIIVLEGKETPGSFKNEEIDILLTTLNMDFRRDVGRRTIFVIPTTSSVVAQQVSERAASIGGMTSLDKPFYVFNGPPRNEYINITNNTLRALNESRTLLDYGVTDEIAKDLAESASSIGAFMGSCYNEITRQRDSLEQFAAPISRKRIHLWMIFCSMEENSRRNDDIIRSLTVGDLQHVQVRRVLTGDSKEVRFWESRKETFGIIADYLDLRIMYLPLRTANAIVTAYGHKELLEYLKALTSEEGGPVIKREAVRARAQESLTNTAIGAFLRGEGFIDRDPSKRGNLGPKQQELFKEIVKLAIKDDKALNGAIAATLRDWLKEPGFRIATEVPLNETSSLITDIAVITDTDIYCLEIKWRSSLLNESDVIRETTGRISEFARELPELNMLLGSLE
jgi:energy-coupling factor transporter ATP-binding protein EcfA2